MEDHDEHDHDHASLMLEDEEIDIEPTRVVGVEEERDEFWDHDPNKEELWEMKKANKRPSEWLKLICREWAEAEENLGLIETVDGEFESYKPYLRGKLSSQLLCRLCIPSGADAERRKQQQGMGNSNNYNKADFLKNVLHIEDDFDRAYIIAQVERFCTFYDIRGVRRQQQQQDEAKCDTIAAAFENSTTNNSNGITSNSNSNANTSSNHVNNNNSNNNRSFAVSNNNNNNNNNEAQTQTIKPFHAEAFSKKHTGTFASGMQLVDRKEFAETFDTGVPLDQDTVGNNKVLLLYSDKSAFPDTHNNHNNNNNYHPTVREATANCNNLHVLLTQADSRTRQCIAVVGQYESYHVQKFMRVDPTLKKGGIDPSLPLSYVARGYQQNGRKSHKVPTLAQSKQHWKNLVEYLQTLLATNANNTTKGKGENSINTDGNGNSNSNVGVIESLTPVLKEVASHNDHNTVIVMVCNFGQSELLLNFICNARAKGFGDILRNVFVFATDQETQDLAEHLGIASVYIESIFGSMPTNAARRYADSTFQKMMAAKVYCVQMVSMLGHDILFQDVDVIWYKNPLEWFHDANNPHYHFDMYFQDDGNHALFYAPYSANTGFYYVRNNPRTQFFFNALLMAGDLILSTSSHQIALIALLNEHTSLYGLRVKIWDRNKREFPGGFTFHNHKASGYMKELMATNNNDHDHDTHYANGSDKTYIFHMSWTSSKKDKVKFFQQMGEWYLEDTCNGVQTTKFVAGASNECCSATPLIQCHYRDKPSKIPCKESPPIDKGARSFW